MKQFIYLAVCCVLALSACTGAFKKGADGLEYKVISRGEGKKLSYGNFMQIHIKQVYSGTKDTILMNTWDFTPRIQLFDSASMPPSYFKILGQMKKGDSVVMRTLTDSVFNKPDREMPPFMKKGKYLYIYVTLVNFFEDKNQADSANKAEQKIARPRIFKKQMEEIEKEMKKNQKQLDIDDKLIQDYLTKNNIKAQKTKLGTYVSISAAGVGNNLSYDDIATINYTGRTLDSAKVFDSNTDPTFGHMQPYELAVGEIGGVIIGWTDALLQLKKGSKATIFIPSSLAYGAAGREPSIRTNQILVFDMDIVDATSTDAMMAKQEEMQKKMIEEEARKNDSLQKVKK